MTKNMKMALCEGRHKIPEATDGSFFPGVVNPTDPKGLEAYARKKLREMFPVPGFKVAHVDLYVTGLSVALVAVINAALNGCVSLTLWHYDRDTGAYFPQEVNHDS